MQSTCQTKVCHFCVLIDFFLTCGQSSDLLKTGNFVESKAVYIYTSLFNVFP